MKANYPSEHKHKEFSGRTVSLRNTNGSRRTLWTAVLAGIALLSGTLSISINSQLFGNDNFTDLVVALHSQRGVLNSRLNKRALKMDQPSSTENLASRARLQSLNRNIDQLIRTSNAGTTGLPLLSYEGQVAKSRWIQNASEIHRSAENLNAAIDGLPFTNNAETKRWLTLTQLVESYSSKLDKAILDFEIYHEASIAVQSAVASLLRFLCLITILGALANYWRGRLARETKILASGKLALEETIDEMELYSRIINDHAIVAVTDPKGTITQVSDLFCKISGYSREELLGQNHRILNSGHHPRQFWTDMFRTLQADLPWHGEVCNRAKDGTLYWVDSTVTAVRNSEGAIASYVSIRIDITAKKVAEQEKAQVDSLLRSVTGGLPGVICKFRRAADGRFTFPYMSEFLSNFCSATAAELAVDATPIFEKIHRDDVGSLLKSIEDSTSDLSHWSFTFRILDPQGNMRWIYGSSVPTSSPDGSIEWAGFLLDVTQQKVAESVRDEYDLRLQKLSDESPGMIFQYRVRSDGSSHFPYVSSGIRDIYGVSPEDVVEDASLLWEIVHPDDLKYLAASIEKSSQHLTRWNCSYRVCLPDSGVRWLYGTSMPEKSEDGSTCWHGCIVDVTEQKLAEEELRLSKDRLDIATQTLKMGVWDWNVTTGELNWSPMVFEILGMPFQSESVSYELFISRVHPDDVERLEHAVQETLRSQDFLKVEFRVIWPDGSIHWVSTDASVIQDETNPDLRMIGIKRDITESKIAEENLTRANEQIKIASRTFGIGTWDLDLVTSEVTWDENMYLLWQRDPSADMDFYEAWYSRIHPNDREEAVRQSAEGIQLVRDFRQEYRIVLDDGSIKWISGQATVVRNEEGQPTRIVGLNIDSTERLTAQKALKESEERYALAARGSNDALWDWNMVTGSAYYSSRYTEMLGLAEGQEITLPGFWSEHVHPDDLPALLDAVALVTSGERQFLDSEYRLRSATGDYCWMRARAICTHDASGTPLRMVGSVSDIHERKMAQDELEVAATSDLLTGLANRSKFQQRLAQVAKRFEQDPTQHFAVLFLDFDRFKVVNDSLGHDVGDQLLKAIAIRLTQSIRMSDSFESARAVNLAGRLGGDEFVVLLEAVGSPEDAVAVGERLLAKLGEPYYLGDHVVHTTASIGIVLPECSNTTADEILRDADTAMYEAKSNGKNCCVVFDIKMRERVQNRLEMENDLRVAIANQQFELMYQPIVHIGSSEVETFEALVRWNHPTKGLISPADFIPVAEDAGLIPELGEWVLTEAACQLAEWQREYPHMAPPGISVNVSRKQVQLPDFPTKAKMIVDSAGLDPSSIHLEVTESAITVDPKQAQETLKQLKSFGFGIHLDDFGTGYTSLADVDLFPLDVVKIDKVFITDISEGGPHIDMVRAICTVASSVGAKVIAEGIETEEQLRILYYIGVDMAQGYLVSRPLTKEAAIKFYCDLGSYIRPAA